MSSSTRTETYAHLSTALSCLSDIKLSGLLHQAQPMHTGIGGKSVLLTIDDQPVFVKKIPLTDVERQPHHILSTSNLFNLPLFYQYGIGSAGFGAWRELVAHIITTNWVLGGSCPNFPLLYHWRVLPTSKRAPMDAAQIENLEHDADYWDNTPTVRNRLEAIHKASAHVVLFLEYIPETLHQWLGRQLKEDKPIAETAVLWANQSLKAAINFMNAQGFFHFDAHFDNILTDGQLIYLSDFGLALSSQFDLTKPEIDFLQAHRTYDQCAMIVNLLHSVITHTFGKDQWEMKLQAFINEEKGELTPAVAAMVKHYAPVALIMDQFYKSLQKASKSTPYPANRLKALLVAIDRKEI